MKTSITLALLGGTLATLSGCATVTTDANQTVQITTEDENHQPVQGAECVLKNERGEWHLKTQGVTKVHKSADNLLVNCTKKGMADGEGTLISRSNAGMWGNILLGGVVGAIVDHNKGTAYNYPSWIRIVMGENLVFDRDEQDGDKLLIGKAMTDDEVEKIKAEKQKAEQLAKEKQLAKSNN